MGEIVSQVTLRKLVICRWWNFFPIATNFLALVLIASAVRMAKLLATITSSTPIMIFIGIMITNGSLTLFHLTFSSLVTRLVSQEEAAHKLVLLRQCICFLRINFNSTK